MTYNRFLYNTALYNAGRTEEFGIGKSIIQAHTGPHIQAVVGSTSGVAFISDFIITEGTIRKPPAQFKFPDLSAFIRIFQISPSSEGQADGFAIDNLDAFIKGNIFKDLPVCLFPSDRIPDLKSIIFGLFEADLAAVIIGQLGEHDLAAIIQANAANLAAIMQGISAPILRGQIFGNSPGNLGARIHAPLDLFATMIPVQFGDVLAAIRGFQVADLPGRMLGIPTPEIVAFIKGFVADIRDFPTKTTASLVPMDIGGFLNSSIPGPDDFIATVTGTGGFNNMGSAIRIFTDGLENIGASIQTGGQHNLPVVMGFLGVKNIQGIIGTITIGSQDRFLDVFLQPVNLANLNATMTFSENVAFLGAKILSLRDQLDLTAILKVSETFVTAILTVITMASSSLKATVGKPDCAGGSANAILSAFTTAQHKGDMSAFLESFVEKNLGANINSEDLFFAFDTIGISFSPFVIERTNFTFNATDNIPIFFSVFRANNLTAIINVIRNNVFLPATITATFPLPKVVPSIEVIQAIDINNNPERDPQEIRLRLEGSLLEYLYVNGTDQAFIKDPTANDWKINIRSFKPIAEGLFGDFAAARICKLGSLTNFATMDQAVRFCIQSVIGLEQDADMGAFINAAGQLNNLPAFMGVSSNLGNVGGFLNQVFPFDMEAIITPDILEVGFIGGFIVGSGTGTGDMGAFLGRVEALDLVAAVSGSGDIQLLGALIDIIEFNNFGAIIEQTQNKKSVLFGGVDEYITGTTTLNDLGFVKDPRQFSVAFWIKWDTVADPKGPTEIDNTGLGTYHSILGASSIVASTRNPVASGPGWQDGFGFYWETDTGSGNTLQFWVNDFNNNSVASNIITLSNWHHVVGTYDADLVTDNIKMYLDGVLRNTKNHTANVTGLSNLFEIGRVGADQVTEGFPTQYMDEICVWSGVALSGPEVAEIHDIPSLDLRATRGAYTSADKIAVYYQFENTAITFPNVYNVIASGTVIGTMINMEVTDIIDISPS